MLHKSICVPCVVIAFCFYIATCFNFIILTSFEQTKKLPLMYRQEAVYY